MSSICVKEININFEISKMLLVRYLLNEFGAKSDTRKDTKAIDNGDQRSESLYLVVALQKNQI